MSPLFFSEVQEILHPAPFELREDFDTAAHSHPLCLKAQSDAQQLIFYRRVQSVSNRVYPFERTNHLQWASTVVAEAVVVVEAAASAAAVIVAVVAAAFAAAVIVVVSRDNPAL